MNNAYNVGLIRVVTIKEPEILNLHGTIIEKKFPQLNVVSKCIQDQDKGIHDQRTEDIAVPKIIELAKEWKDIDALIISCAGDPAVKELREQLAIPIVGAGESTALLSLRYGTKFGVLGITDEVPEAYNRILGDNIVGTCNVDGVTSTLDLQNELGRKKVIEKAMTLKEQGAQVISLACTGMSTIGIAKELEQICQIPVIDPVIAEGLIAYYECINGVK